MKPEDIAEQSLDLDEVESNMGVRSEPFYGNSGSALSDYERAYLAAILLDEMDATEGVVESTPEEQIDDRKANAFRTRFKFEIEKQWGKPLVFDDVTEKQFREASLRMMEDMLDDVNAYEQKIHEGVRQCMQLLLSGQPLGAPASWFA